jgi:hypothetical protein
MCDLGVSQSSDHITEQSKYLEIKILQMKYKQEKDKCHITKFHTFAA